MQELFHPFFCFFRTMTADDSFRTSVFLMGCTSVPVSTCHMNLGEPHRKKQWKITMLLMVIWCKPTRSRSFSKANCECHYQKSGYSWIQCCIISFLIQRAGKTYSTIWAPQWCERWFRFAPGILVRDLCTINHSEIGCYWIYLHQVSYRTGGSHKSTTFEEYSPSIIHIQPMFLGGSRLAWIHIAPMFHQRSMSWCFGSSPLLKQARLQR